MQALVTAITLECMYQWTKPYMIGRETWFISIWAKMDNYIADKGL